MDGAGVQLPFHQRRKLDPQLLAVQRCLSGYIEPGYSSSRSGAPPFARLVMVQNITEPR